MSKYLPEIRCRKWKITFFKTPFYMENRIKIWKRHCAITKSSIKLFCLRKTLYSNHIFYDHLFGSLCKFYAAWSRIMVSFWNILPCCLQTKMRPICVSRSWRAWCLQKRKGTNWGWRVPDRLRVCQSADLTWAIFPTVIPSKLPEIIELGTH